MFKRRYVGCYAIVYVVHHNSVVVCCCLRRRVEQIVILTMLEGVRRSEGQTGHE